MAKVIVEFNDLEESEVDRVAHMIREGLFDLGDGGFFQDTCREKGIENFDSVNFNIIVVHK